MIKSAKNAALVKKWKQKNQVIKQSKKNNIKQKMAYTLSFISALFNLCDFNLLFGNFEAVLGKFKTFCFNDAFYIFYLLGFESEIESFDLIFGFDLDNFVLDHEIIMNILHIGFFKSKIKSKFKLFKKNINFSRIL